MTGKFPLAFNYRFARWNLPKYEYPQSQRNRLCPKTLTNPHRFYYTIPAGYIIRAFIRLLVGRIRLAAQDTALSRRRSGVRIPYALPTPFPVLRLFPARLPGGVFLLRR